MASLQSALEELVPTEQRLQHAFGRAFFLYTSGVLSRAQYDEYNRLRLELTALRATVYEIARSILEPIGQADEIPELVPYPTLGPFEAQPGAPALAPVAPGPVQPPAPSAPGLPPVGLGVLQVAPIVWAALVLAFIARLVVIGALAWVVWRVAQVGGDTVRGIFLARENTARYGRQLDDSYKRFMACLRRTGDPAQCRELFPAPEAPQERQPDPPMDPALLGVGIAATVLSIGAVGGLAWYGTQALPTPRE